MSLEDGENLEAMFTQTVDDTVAAQENFTDILTSQLGDAPPCARSRCSSLRGGDELHHPALRSRRVVPCDVVAPVPPARPSLGWADVPSIAAALPRSRSPIHAGADELAELLEIEGLVEA